MISFSQTINFKRDIHGAKVAAVLSRPANWFVANLLTLGLAVTLLICYAQWANLLGSVRYQEGLLKNQLLKVNENRNSLLSEKSSVTELDFLLSYARRTGLVEEKNIEYIFGKGSLAQAGAQ